MRVQHHARSQGETQTSKVVTHLVLAPRQTLSWRVTADSDIQAHSPHVWLTRLFSPYDYWMKPGDVTHISRGERIWLRTHGELTADVTLTSDYAERRNVFIRWVGRSQEIALGVSELRAR